MSSAATGSLGALLMIAPLAAIPVFAIVGMPRFSSMVAAPGEEEEVYDLGPAVEEETPADQKLRDRGADDLFAPIDSPRSKSKSRAAGGRRSPRLKDRDSSLGAPEDETEISPMPGRGLRGRVPSSASPKPDRFYPGHVHPEVDSPGSANSETRPGRIARPAPHQDTDDAGRNELPSGAGDDADRWLAAKQRIQELDITWHQLNPEEDRNGKLMFVFTCFVTTPGEPSHRYAASGPTPIAAVEATLSRIEDLKR